MKNTLESIRNIEDHMEKRITEQEDKGLDFPQIEEERGSKYFYFFYSFLCLFFFNLFFYFLNFKIFNSYKRSQTWTPLPPPSPQHPSGSSPCTSPKHAVSCIRHRLAIQFLHDSIHVRMSFSQIIPPSPSLWVQKSVIHICVLFPVLHTGSSLPSS